MTMKSAPRPSLAPRTARVVRQRIEAGGERLWRLEDFSDLSFPAVAQALSRLSRASAIRRLSKGVYYRTRPTTLGESRPNPVDLQALARRRIPLFPAGVSAANLLGFTSQSAAHGELSTSASSLPRKLVGEATVVHTRRPAAWADLSQEDGALLEFLRDGGKNSELSPEETVARTLRLLAEKGRFRRLMSVAESEPPRVRALLGAFGTELEASRASLARLRATLNPLSRFDFGAFAQLPSARAWLAKGAN